MKVYKEYKEIEVKDIKGVKANAICSKNLEKVCRYMEVIKKEGIKKPFEVIQKRKWVLCSRWWNKIISSKSTRI